MRCKQVETRTQLFFSLSKSIQCSNHFRTVILQLTPIAHLGESQQVDVPLKGVQTA